MMALKHVGEIEEEQTVQPISKINQAPTEIPGQSSSESIVTKPVDENIPAHNLAMDRSFSSPSLGRKPSIGEDPAAMTIEFLRARLLSERSVSKAARQRAQQLAKKVLELEHQLESEVQLRRKVESARLEALTKYKGELITEYGNLFVSNSGEDDFDEKIEGQRGDGYSGVSLRSRSDDMEQYLEHERTDGEGFLQLSSVEDEEGSSVGRMDKDDRSGSARQLNSEEDGDEGSINGDEELGRDKGVLAWQRRRGIRRQQDKERGQSIERFGKSFSQKMFATSSTDGELSHKKWIGKSVRQIRKKESRPKDSTSDEGMGLSQEAEDAVGEGPQQDEKQALNCDEERDTEVEKVLERQAELIEQYEAEEDAQRAWEEKFRAQNPSISSGIGQGISLHHRSSKEKSSVVSVTGEENTKEGGQLREDAAKEAGAYDCGSSQHIEDEAGQKVPNDGCHKEGAHVKEIGSSTQSQFAHNTISEDLNTVQEYGKIEPHMVVHNGIGPVSENVVSRSEDFQGDSDSGIVLEDRTLKDKTVKERPTGGNETAGEAESECQKTTEIAKCIPSETDSYNKATGSGQDSDLPTAGTEMRQAAREKPSGLLKEGVSQNQLVVSDMAVKEEVGLHNKRLSSSFKFNVHADYSNEKLDVLMKDDLVLSMSPRLPDLSAASMHSQQQGSSKGYTVSMGEQVCLSSSRGTGFTADDVSGHTRNENNSRGSSEVEGAAITGEREAVEISSTDGDQAQLVAFESELLQDQVGYRNVGVPLGGFSFDQTKPVVVREMRDQGVMTHENTNASFASEVSRKAGEDHFSDLNLRISSNNLNQHGTERSQSVNCERPPFVREGPVVQGETGVNIQNGTYGRTSSQAPWLGAHSFIDGNSSQVSSENAVMRNFAAMAFQDTHYDRGDPHTELQGDSPWEDTFRRRIRTHEVGHEKLGPARNSYDYLHYPSQIEGDVRRGHPQYAAANHDRSKLDFFSSLPARRTATLEHSSARVGGHSYQDPTLLEHRKSVDGGFDRVMEVLRALQIAKNQIQSSDDQTTLLADLDAAYRNDYVSREQFSLEQPSGYPAPSHFFADPTAYPSPHTRVLKPSMPDLGVRAAAAVYASSSSRLMGNVREHTHMQYPSRGDPRTRQNLWTTEDAHNSYLDMMHDTKGKGRW